MKFLLKDDRKSTLNDFIKRLKQTGWITRKSGGSGDQEQRERPPTSTCWRTGV